MEDQRLEIIVSNLLRAGVGASALLVIAGAAVYLSQHGAAVADYRTFHGEPAAYRSLAGLLSLQTLRQGRGLIQLGLVLLIFTPIARVALTLILFVVARDRIYVVVTTIVLATLLYSFFSA
ncbi:MAG TPA: DUF1634 domain-containing protein [Bryobacteraceae bacterium]|nr:DUF1634 domain-containing protein [Bryobacteraceae bacterium]